MPALTALVWALAAASALYWGLRIRGEASGGQAPAPVAAPAEMQPDPRAVARALGVEGEGAAAPPASVASRFALQGVVASPSGGGSALIAVDGQPARPYRVGSAVGEGWVLRSVAARQAVLAAEGGAAVTLELPPLKP